MTRKCPWCGRMINSLGYASHRAGHNRRGDTKLGVQPVKQA